MNKLKEKLVVTKMKALCKMHDLTTKKENGDKAIIVELVFIAIAVALVLIFRTQIQTLITDFMTSVTTKINGALS